MNGLDRGRTGDGAGGGEPPRATGPVRLMRGPVMYSAGWPFTNSAVQGAMMSTPARLTEQRGRVAASHDAAPVTASTPPHPVLEEYYSSAADRQSFVGALFDGAARHYNRIGQMLDLGSGPWYRRWTLRRAGLRPGMRLLDGATGTSLVARG